MRTAHRDQIVIRSIRDQLVIKQRSINAKTLHPFFSLKGKTILTLISTILYLIIELMQVEIL